MRRLFRLHESIEELEPLLSDGLAEWSRQDNCIHAGLNYYNRVEKSLRPPVVGITFDSYWMGVQWPGTDVQICMCQWLGVQWRGCGLYFSFQCMSFTEKQFRDDLVTQRRRLGAYAFARSAFLIRNSWMTLIMFPEKHLCRYLEMKLSDSE